MGATSATTDRPALTAADCAAALEALRERPPLVQSPDQHRGRPVDRQRAAGGRRRAGHGRQPARGRPVRRGSPARVLVNLGTPYDDTALAMEQAVAAADRRTAPRGCSTRWPPAPCSGAPTLALRPARARPSGRHPRQRLGDHGADRRRRRQGRRLRAHPGGRPGRGARARRRCTGTVVAVSGPVDHLTDGERVVRVAQRAPVADPGHRRRLRARRTGGCLRRRRSPTRCSRPPPRPTTLTVAAESAAASSRGPGSFAVALLDDLAALSPRGWATPARLS